jgi:hypothetical protein
MVSQKIGYRTTQFERPAAQNADDLICTDTIVVQCNHRATWGITGFLFNLLVGKVRSHGGSWGLARGWMGYI